MEQNNFLNKGALSYLQAHDGNTVSKRLENLERYNADFIKFMDEYEKYVEASVQQSVETSELNRLQLQEQNAITFNRVSQLEDNLRGLRKGLQVVVSLYLITVGLAAGVGLFVWLIKR